MMAFVLGEEIEGREGGGRRNFQKIDQSRLMERLRGSSAL